MNCSKRKITAVLLCLALLCSLAGCKTPASLSSDSGPSVNTIDNSAPPTDGALLKPPMQSQEAAPLENGRSSIMSLDSSGELSVDRMALFNNTPMGQPGTWTIFVYLCGSDLETNYGAATMDLQEMLKGLSGGSVRFVVETGGAGEWMSSQIHAGYLERYVIENGTIELVEQLPRKNMGNQQTLQDFLAWGVQNYSASNMGVIFWNHGGGSISGVCFDELESYDSLSLSEIDEALMGVFSGMTDKFEFIGFDACLMGTVETACILATYANYMIASEETEPGSGWDYTAIGRYLCQNPYANGAQLGKQVADSFYEDCRRYGQEDDLTMSVIQLNQIDALVAAFHTYAKNIYDATSDTETLAYVVRAIYDCENFGGNNSSTGYTNMVDLGGVIQACAEYAEGAEEAMQCLERAVVYQRIGRNHQNATGLAVYYPLEIQGSMELNEFGKISISPAYLSFVDRAAYSYANAGDMMSYDSGELIEEWEDYQQSGYDAESYEGHWDEVDSAEQTGQSPYIKFAEGPTLDEDGNYYFFLAEESIPHVRSVQGVVYMYESDEEDMILLGYTGWINMDWSQGFFCDNFDGNWFCLPNGQLLSAYLVSEEDGYDIYYSPILLNGEETGLFYYHDYTNEEIQFVGIWSGIDENGMASRDVVELSEGDELVSLFVSYSTTSDEMDYYYSQPYIYQAGDDLIYDYLPDGEYYYGFSIDDIYGDYYDTDCVNFTVDGYDIYFSRE